MNAENRFPPEEEGYWENWQQYLQTMRDFDGDFPTIVQNFRAIETQALEDLNPEDHQTLTDMQAILFPHFHLRYASKFSSLFPFAVKWSDIPNAPIKSSRSFKLLFSPRSVKSPTHIEKIELDFSPELTMDLVDLMSDFFKQLSKLSHLHYLGIKAAKIPQLADYIAELSSLKQIQIINCDIKEIPRAWEKLRHVTYLHIRDHALQDISNMIHLSTLKICDFQYNQIATLPDEIGRLARLIELKIPYNKITELPESIGKLTTLELLNCGHNQLASLPDSIKNLTQLKNIILTKNRFNTVPPIIQSLPHLRKCILKENNIREIPKWITEIKPGNTPEFIF